MHIRTKAGIIRAITVIAIFAVWEGGVRAELIDPVFSPPLPSEIAVRLVEWLAAPKLYLDLLITFYETAVGYVLGTVVGIVLGLWLALRPLASLVVEPFVKAFNAVPRIVLAPIFVLWFGLGTTSKIALVVTLVFFLAFFNTYQAIRDVNPVFLANARLLRASGPNLMRHVYLPSATSWILSSLRASIGLAVTGAVVSEYLGAASGIGHAIALAQGNFDNVGVFAGMVVLSVFVLILDTLLSQIEQRLLIWKPTSMAGEPA